MVYVLHEGMRSVRIATEYKLFPEEWDEKSQSVVFREKYRFSYVTDIDLRIKKDVSALQNIIKSFPNYSAKDILQAFHIHRQDKSFLVWERPGIICAREIALLRFFIIKTLSFI